MLIALTGGSSGLGAAVVDQAAARGLGTVTLGRSQPAHGAFLELDLSEPSAIAPGVNRLLKRFGAPDALVCCAAVARAEDPADEWALEELIRVNAISHLVLARALAEAKPAAHPLQVVFVSSLAAFRDFPDLAGYGVAKAALERGAQALRARLLTSSSQVTVFRPGPMRTPFFERNGVSPPPDAAEVRPIAGALLDGLITGLPTDVTVGSGDAREVGAYRPTEVLVI